jgi:hypothetical protein
VHKELKLAPNAVTAEVEYQNRRKIKQQNYNIMSQKGFNLDRGTLVLVYTDPKPLGKRRTVIRDKLFMVVGNRGALYKIIDDSGAEFYVPRYKLRLAY